jgi:hypothetical protein
MPFFVTIQNSGTIDKKGRQKIDKCHNLKKVKKMALFAKKGRQNSDKCHFLKSDKYHFMLKPPYFFGKIQKMALIDIMPIIFPPILKGIFVLRIS